MSDNEEERHSYKIIILHGPDNFAQWELSIGTTLLGKGLLDCISTDVPLGLPVKEAAKEKFRYGKAFAVRKSHIERRTRNLERFCSLAERSLSRPSSSCSQSYD